ncbi:hypothetical protein BB561_005795 [Smittium simulii]|uniref:Uncharacterized protein n=1 Tax=Smittium simulii TaxID=133385 RepID=A0A2T9Y881_9FUNG|nr:hypothetical protein BB561_005795 [Smittium simulii]
MKQLTRNMAGVVGGMEKAMQSMNLEQISMVMDKFEQQFEDLNVQTESMESSIGGVVAEDVPVEQVDQLMLQIADEAGLELNNSLVASQVPNIPLSQKSDNLALNERLYKLRNS